MMPDQGIPQGAPPTAAGNSAVTLFHIGRVAFALLCGLLIFTGLAAALTRLAGVEAPPRPGAEKLQLAAICLAATMLLTSYLVARIAGRWQLPVAGGLGAFLSLGAARAHLEWQGLAGPLAIPAAVLILTPFALLGAWAAGGMARRDAKRRAGQVLELPLAIRNRSGFLVLVLLLSLGITAASLWATTLEKTSQSPWIAALFFGGASLLMAWRLVRNRPHAIVRDEGIELPLFQAVIPWSEILGAAQHPLHPVAYLKLQVVDAQKYVARLNPAQVALTQLGEPEPNIGFPLTGTPYTVEQIAALVQSKVRGPRA